MTAQRSVLESNPTMTSIQTDHEEIFNQICSQLNELSHHEVTPQNIAEEKGTAGSAKFETMQNQMKKFNSELRESQEEIKNKIKNLGSVHFGVEALDQQVRQLADQLASERTTNTKLSADLAKSLELSLQLQLEIQSLKARNAQIQGEEKKYSAALLERSKVLQRDLELTVALKDETTLELAKAKSAFQKEQSQWLLQKEQLQNQIQDLSDQLGQSGAAEQELQEQILKKDQEIASLHRELEEIQNSFSAVESSTQQQQEVLDNLMSVAEGKIVEMKMALDKKSIEAQDYYSHLQQALTQLAVARQENASLKDYINKLNYYHQQAMGAAMNQQSPMANQGK